MFLLPSMREVVVSKELERLDENELEGMLRLYPVALARLYTCKAVRSDGIVQRGAAERSEHSLEGWLHIKLEVEKRLRRLDERRRRAVLLYYLLGLRQREIASRLGVSQPRLSQLLNRARVEMT